MFAIFSDLHLHEWAYGASVLDSGLNSRLVHQEAALNKMLDIIDEQGIRLLFFCGDFFHTHGKVSAQCLGVAERFLRRAKNMGLRMTFLVGNHDMANKEGTIHSLELLRSYAEVIDTPVVRTYPDLSKGSIKFLMIPYTEKEEVMWASLRDLAPTVDYICMHQGVADVPMGSGFVINEFLKPDMIPSNVVHAFTGHYHNHRRVSPNLTIVGAPLQLTWADSGEERGFLIVKDNEIKHVPLPGPKFVKLPVRTSDMKNVPSIAGNFVRATDYDGDVSAIRKMLLKMGALYVEVETAKKQKQAEPTDAVDSFDLQVVIKDFEKKNEVSEYFHTVGEKLRDGRYTLPVFKA